MIRFHGYYIQVEILSAYVAGILVGYETTWVWGVVTFLVLFTLAPRLT